MPEDKGEYYDIKNDPANFTDTRSVADEYYTVNDIISGNIVTLNGHELLCQIVNSEIGGEWGEEAIKAQAVAAYTWVRFNDSIGAIPTVGLLLQQQVILPPARIYGAFLTRISSV